MAQRDAVFPANRHALYEAHGYSAAIRSDNLLFVSGQVGSRDDGSPEPDFGDQVRLAFANLKATLLAAGCTGTPAMHPRDGGTQAPAPSEPGAVTNDLRRRIAELALSLVGVPYRYGGAVSVESIDAPYYQRHLVAVGRLIP